ncbi:MAG: hypothetical protein ACLGGO_07280 [Coleofasciculus sp.]
MKHYHLSLDSHSRQTKSTANSVLTTNLLMITVQFVVALSSPIRSLIYRRVGIAHQKQRAIAIWRFSF